MSNKFFDDDNYNPDEFEEINEESLIKEKEEQEYLKEEPNVVYVEREITSLSFKNFPDVIRKKILYSIGITAVINIILLGVLILFTFNVYVLFILIALDFISFGNIYYQYTVTKNINFRIFDGFIVSVENKGIVGTSSTYKRIIMCNEDESKFLSFDYKGKAKVNNGFPVSIYIPRNEEVKIVNELPYIENVLAVTFGERKNDLDINNDSKTVDDFLN